MTCQEPVPFETLVALWTGDLGPDESDRAEQHLFACDACADASDRLGKLAAGLWQVIPPVISHAHRDRLVAAGTRIRYTPVKAGVETDAYFVPDVDLLVHVLEADLTGAERVDVQLLDAQGVVRLELAHVPFDGQTGEVLIACQRHYQHNEALTSDPVFQVHAYQGGVRREVGSFFVRHHWG
jgi:hypothetical protein